MLLYIYDYIISGGIFLNESHTVENPKKKRVHVRITLENSMDANEIPVSVPRLFLSASDIKAKEEEGRTIIFVVTKTQKSTSSIDLKPLRDSAGNYLVIVCW